MKTRGTRGSPISRVCKGLNQEIIWRPCGAGARPEEPKEQQTHCCLSGSKQPEGCEGLFSGVSPPDTVVDIQGRCSCSPRRCRQYKPSFSFLKKSSKMVIPLGCYSPNLQRQRQHTPFSLSDLGNIWPGPAASTLGLHRGKQWLDSSGLKMAMGNGRDAWPDK